MKQSEIIEKTNNFMLNDSELLPRQKSWNVLQHSGQTGKVYQGTNQALLQCIKFDKGFDHDARLTWKSIQDVGGKIDKGEKASWVVFWKTYVKEVIEGGEPIEKKIRLLRYSNVWNKDQTNIRDEAIKTYESVTGTSDEVWDSLVEQPKLELGPQPAYSPFQDVIKIPPKANFTSLEEYRSTLWHETGHWTGPRMGRFKPTDKVEFGSESYSLEELVAEFFNAYMSCICGIENKTRENSRAYLHGWNQKLKSDPKMLMKGANQAWKALMYALRDTKYLPEVGE